MKLAPGRLNDWHMLQKRLERTTDHDRRWRILDKMNFLLEEAKDEKICYYRKQLIQAARVNDTLGVNLISERIQAHQVKKGVSSD